MTEKNRIEWSLLLLRLGVFIVMFVWTLDKFVAPGHAAKVFEHFYFLSGLGKEIVFAIAAVEMVIVLAFLAGLYKKWIYGIVMIVHGISTLSSWKIYLDPWPDQPAPNLLFFAAWPMLAACIALFLLRDLDRKCILGKG
ncbi:MAG: hypothetical protein D6782_00795 [Alphaproteobacteria bacterium]|nr:MAG: hypothetical protein D6782_00795 [Alphaproteobacteria bacterium]